MQYKFGSRFHRQFFFDKVGLSQKICSFKFNSVAKFQCQISVTKVGKLSNII